MTGGREELRGRSCFINHSTRVRPELCSWAAENNICVLWIVFVCVCVCVVYENIVQKIHRIAYRAIFVLVRVLERAVKEMPFSVDSDSIRLMLAVFHFPRMYAAYVWFGRRVDKQPSCVYSPQPSIDFRHRPLCTLPVSRIHPRSYTGHKPTHTYTHTFTQWEVYYSATPNIRVLCERWERRWYMVERRVKRAVGGIRTCAIFMYNAPFWCSEFSLSLSLFAPETLEGSRNSSRSHGARAQRSYFLLYRITRYSFGLLIAPSSREWRSLYFFSMCVCVFCVRKRKSSGIAGFGFQFCIFIFSLRSLASLPFTGVAHCVKITQGAKSFAARSFHSVPVCPLQQTAVVRGSISSRIRRKDIVVFDIWGQKKHSEALFACSEFAEYC